MQWPLPFIAYFAMFGAMTVFANPAHYRLVQLPDGERNAMLGNLLKGSGESCNGVKKNFFQGKDKSGAAFWNVECRNGKTYVIMIYNDSVGSTKLLECEIIKMVGGVPCFKKF